MGVSVAFLCVANNSWIGTGSVFGDTNSLSRRVTASYGSIGQFQTFDFANDGAVGGHFYLTHNNWGRFTAEMNDGGFIQCRSRDIGDWQMFRNYSDELNFIAASQGKPAPVPRDVWILRNIHGKLVRARPDRANQLWCDIDAPDSYDKVSDWSKFRIFNPSVSPDTGGNPEVM